MSAAEVLRNRISKGEAYFVALDALAVVEAAEAFVATTSYYRQTRASRPEFETLAEALLTCAASGVEAQP